MFKTTFSSIFLVCLAGIVLGTPRISSDSDVTLNTVNAELNTERPNAFSFALATFEDPKEFQFEKIPMIQVVGLNEVAKNIDLSLDEFMYLIRIEMQMRKNEKEGKKFGEGLDQQTRCDELKSILPRNSIKSSNEKKSKWAGLVQEMRESCSVFDILQQFPQQKLFEFQRI